MWTMSVWAVAFSHVWGPNKRLERSRGLRLRWAKEGVDDWDKAVSFCRRATPRRSTSSLGVRQIVPFPLLSSSLFSPSKARWWVALCT